MNASLALASLRPALARGGVLAGRSRSVAARALDTNIFVNLIASAACGSAAIAVTTLTAEDTDAAVAKLQTQAGIVPVAAGLVGDAAFHSIPGINLLFQLLAEPAGAACGVSYMMLLLLSSAAVDPATLAPKGTVVNAEKATDNRKLVRVPFSRIIPTALKVVDTSNSGFSGAGWAISDDGLPRLPVTSVAIVIGVGTVILEAAAHAPVLSLFLPRVFTAALCLAAAGAVLGKDE